jgi:hypothetical protein
MVLFAVTMACAVVPTKAEPPARDVEPESTLLH